MRNTAFTRKSNYPKLKTRQRNYDPESGLWIGKNKNIFLCWYLFLQQAIREERLIDWKKYEGWGGEKIIAEQRFDDWWQERWKVLFGYKKGDKPKFNTTSKQTSFNYLYDSYVVYTNRNLSNSEIADLLFTKNAGVIRRWDDPQEAQSRIGRMKKKAETVLENVCVGSFPN